MDKAQIIERIASEQAAVAMERLSYLFKTTEGVEEELASMLEKALSQAAPLFENVGKRGE